MHPFVAKSKLSSIPVSQIQDIGLKSMHAITGFSFVDAHFETQIKIR